MTLSDEIRDVEKGKVDGYVVYFPAGRTDDKKAVISDGFFILAFK